MGDKTDLGQILDLSLKAYELQLARFQAISAGIVVKEPSGRIKYVNNAACDMFGLTCEEFIGRLADDGIWRTVKLDGSPMQAEEYPSTIVSRTGAIQRNVIFGIYSGKHGPRRWLMEDAIPVKDPATGKVNEVLLTITDITEQTHNKNAGQEAETKFKSLIEESLVGVYLIQDGKFVYVNPRMAEIHGYSQSKLIGTHVLDITAEKDREIVAENIRRRIEGEAKSTHYTIQALRMDGTPIDVEVYGSHTLYRGQPAVIGTELDITQRKRDEETLRLNEARLQALLELSQMTNSPLHEITDFALQQAIKLTKSEVGYLAFTNEDETVLNMFAWSPSARQQCIVSDKPTVYPVETTGLWGEAIRQRKPIITNDYPSPNQYKKGLPEGHIPLKNHMNVPVFDGEHIIAVAGVGNKNGDYDESDVRQLTLLMDGMWKLLQRNRAEMERKEAEASRRQFEKALEMQKRLFYRETILSVTDGKLDICDAPVIRQYITTAAEKVDVATIEQIGKARHIMEDYFATQGLDEERLCAFAIAVGEAITNAVKHGGGGRVYAGTKNGAVWTAVADHGPGIESLILPRATLLRGFSTKPSLGLGYTIMLEAADHILLKTGPRGTTVILIKNIVEPDFTRSIDQFLETWITTV